MRLRAGLPAVLLAGTAFLSPPASAGPLCVGAHVAVLTAPTVDVGPICHDYDGPVTCGTLGVLSADPALDVSVTSCRPR